MLSQFPPTKALTSSDWQQELSKVLLQAQQEKGRAWLCITGNSGSGKSTLGKRLRKYGLPGIPAREIAVIDDGVMSVTVLGLITRRVCHKSPERDNLAPFLPYLKNKKLIIFVKASPHARLERCDAVLRLQCPDPVRRERLIHREAKGEERYFRTQNFCDEVCIATDHIFDLSALSCPPPIKSKLARSAAGLALSLLDLRDEWSPVMEMSL
jgi:adenylate kinase family enzyme